MNKLKCCCLCQTSIDDPLNLGDMKSCSGLNAHYYCLLLASTIQQTGDDHEGILGFLPANINEELERSRTRICSYCNKSGASVICNARNCKIVFHLPCGVKNDSGHQFYGRFLSNCVAHRPKQKYKKPKEQQCCSICYDGIDFTDWTQILLAPCCKRNSYFHKRCIQQMALSAGYFFRCPICNNDDIFQRTMKHFGVFIPDRDASWELEPNAFQELLYRHDSCNVQNCLCPRGRDYSTRSTWSIVLCTACGSQGTHLSCSNLKKDQEWMCETCTAGSNRPPNTNTATAVVATQNGTNNVSRPSTSGASRSDVPSTSSSNTARKRKRSNDDSSSLILEDDSDSDVVIIEDDEANPNYKCVIGQDGQLLPVRNITSRENYFSIQGDLNISKQSKSSDGLQNIVISDVRSLNVSSSKEALAPIAMDKQRKEAQPTTDKQRKEPQPTSQSFDKQRIQSVNGTRQSQTYTNPNEKCYVLCTPAGNNGNSKKTVSIIHNQGNVYILKEFKYQDHLQNNRITEDQNTLNAGKYNSQDSEIVVID